MEGYIVERLRSIVERNDTRAGRIFDWFILFLILVSVISFSLETMPNLDPLWLEALWIVELFTVTLFTLEFLLRVLVAERRLGYIFSFFGLIDLISILPFFIGLLCGANIDLRAVRILRSLRLIRLMKIARYSLAVRRFHRALLIAKEELILFLSVTIMLIYLAAVGIYFFEHEGPQKENFQSVFHSLWWAVVTLTTVGYGDAYPVTVGGRIFTFFILLMGLGIVSVPAGLLASALSKARELED